MSAARPCPCCGAPMPAGVVPREELLGFMDRASPLFARIVRRLARRPGRWCEMAELVDHLYADDIEGGPENAPETIRQTIHRQKDHLLPLGWSIENSQRRYRLAIREEPGRPGS